MRGSRPRALGGAPLALVLAAGGCSIFTDSFQTDEFSGDPFPDYVDTQSGAIMMGVSVLTGTMPPVHAGVIDLLSPVTIVDGGSNAAISIATPAPQVLLYGALAPDEPLVQPRAQLDGPQVITLHPCDTEPCVVGDGANPVPFTAIIGADALAGDAVRVDLGSGAIYILSDIAGDDEHRTSVCDAVYDQPYRGGGTMIINGTELNFVGRRITVGTCLDFDPDPALLQSQRGVDSLFVVSTAIGTSLIGESSYERYRTAENDVPPDLSTLPMDSVTLESGVVTGYRTTIPRFALVGNDLSSSRSPCREVYASHLLEFGDCSPTADCPCRDGGGSNEDLAFCFVTADVEVTPPAGLDVLVIPDSDPTLEALRTELEPDQPEIDGILGTQALATLQLDADYPNDRMLMRCTDHDACKVRPELASETTRPDFVGCIDKFDGE